MKSQSSNISLFSFQYELAFAKEAVSASKAELVQAELRYEKFNGNAEYFNELVRNISISYYNLAVAELNMKKSSCAIHNNFERSLKMLRFYFNRANKGLYRQIYKEYFAKKRRN